MIKIELTTNDPLYQIRRMACLTLGKKPSTNKKFTEQEMYDYWVDAMIANESILRVVHFVVIDDECREDVSSQLLRATKGHPQPECQSHRPDWNKGAKRLPKDESFGMFAHEHTAESFIELCSQRLCTHTMEETKDKVEAVLQIMNESDEPFFKALAFCCVPDCVRFCGCVHGLRGCNKFDMFVCETKIGSLFMSSVRNRYKLWHDYIGI